MTYEDLRRELLVERFGGVVREARAALAGATNWTPAEQRTHAAELVEAVLDYDVGRPRARHLEVA